MPLVRSTSIKVKHENTSRRSRTPLQSAATCLPSIHPSIHPLEWLEGQKSAKITDIAGAHTAKRLQGVT